MESFLFPQQMANPGQHLDVYPKMEAVHLMHCEFYGTMAINNSIGKQANLAVCSVASMILSEVNWTCVHICEMI